MPPQSSVSAVFTEQRPGRKAGKDNIFLSLSCVSRRFHGLRPFVLVFQASIECVNFIPRHLLLIRLDGGVGAPPPTPPPAFFFFVPTVPTVCLGSFLCFRSCLFISDFAHFLTVKMVPMGLLCVFDHIWHSNVELP